MSSAWPSVVASPLILPARRVCTNRKMSDAEPSPPAAVVAGIAIESTPWPHRGAKSREGPVAAAARARALAMAARSDFLVRRHVPAADDFATERPVRLLVLVLELDLGEVQRHLVHRDDVRAGRAAVLERADNRAGEHDLEELLLVLAGPAADQGGILE